MTIIRTLSSLALGLSLSLGAVISAQAGIATTHLGTFDKTTYSGALIVSVDLYAAPDKYGKLGAPKRYPAQLLFARPDQFKLILRPGKSDEFRAVGSAGIVRWLDLATGFSDKEQADKVIDPLALALLSTAGELSRFGKATELVVGKGSKISGARFDPKTYGSGIEKATAWFSSDGKPIGFEFELSDRRRVLISVLSFQQNVPTKPGDFVL
jgi:hypothetical protein